MSKLRPYNFQRDAVRFIESSRPPVQSGYGIIADDCGTGKTVDAALISYLHLDEGSFLIVCTASMKMKWAREIKRWTGKDSYIVYGEKEYHLPKSKFYIINYHILGRENKLDRKKENRRREVFKTNEEKRQRLCKVNGEQFKKKRYRKGKIRLEGWITELAKKNIIGIFPDECFAYDTLISTNKGLLKIGDIVENKLNVKVLSVDSNSRLDEKPILRYISNEVTKRTVKLVHDFGELICTEDHLFWSVTNGKWKRISEFSSNEELCFLRETVYDKEKREAYSKILQSSLLWEKVWGNTWYKENWKRMPKLWENILCDPNHNEKQNLLFSLMRYKLQNKIYRLWKKIALEKSSEENIDSAKKNLSNGNRSRIKEEIIVADDSEQSSNESRSTKKNNSNKKKERHFGYAKVLSRRKWAINKSTNYIKRNIRKKLDLRVSSTNRNENFFEEKITSMLQSRYRKSATENRNRSRWEYAQDEGFNQKRLFENESFRISRVESITFLELGHNGESEENKKINYVYDLTIKDNHNYFANGILVHNCHRLANDETCAWTKCFIKLVSDLQPKVLVPLSGTLTRKRTKNLFPILNMVAPKVFPSKYRFYWRYCDPTRGYAGWEYNGSSNEDELNKKLKKVMIRRLKSEVLKELPPRTFTVIPLELTKLEAKNYSSLDKEYKLLINKQSLQAKNTYSELKLLAYLAKRNSCFNWIDEYLEDRDKLILAAWHKKVINDLYDKYKHIGLKIDGSVQSKKRLEIEDKFQNDVKIKVIILQIDAGGEGLTLTASNAIAIIEMPDTPGQLIQVSDRGHRIGLKSDTFTIYFPFADGTIENKIADEIENSSKSLEAILDGKKGSGLFKYQFKNL